MTTNRTIAIILFALAGMALFNEQTARAQETKVQAQRSRYQIELKIDFDSRSYSGTERLLFVNQTGRPINALYFHLYSNFRNDAINQNASLVNDSEFPRIEILRVKATASDLPLPYSIEDQGTTLKINLRDNVASGGTSEIEIAFRGTVPEIDPDETGLTTHVVKQVSAALRGEKEMRQARDINFRSRGVMLLSTAYPILAVFDGEDWRRRFDPGIGDIIFSEIADYDVRISAASGISVYTSGSETGGSTGQELAFTGEGLRDFAIIAGRNLRSETQQVGEQKVRSIYIAEHERIGRRALNIAANAVRIFSSRFGPLPYETINVVEAPLVAGLGSQEFSRVNVIASAFYVDFDSPAMRNLPEIIREQRPAVEQSLEWTIAHLVAHQWWGIVVGSDPSREPVLDEGLSSWAALLYYRDMHGDSTATTVVEDELRGVYRLYRTFGGDDIEANRPAREYRNSFQYEAIVTTKGALMLYELRQLLGDERFFAALRNYYQTNSFEIAELDDLRGALMAEAPLNQRRAVTRTFTRWLNSKRGDEDIARPDHELATSLGLPVKAEQQKGNDRNAFTAFAKVGKFFWQQMTRIR